MVKSVYINNLSLSGNLGCFPRGKRFNASAAPPFFLHACIRVSKPPAISACSSSNGEFGIVIVHT